MGDFEEVRGVCSSISTSASMEIAQKIYILMKWFESSIKTSNMVIFVSDLGELVFSSSVGTRVRKSKFQSL